MGGELGVDGRVAPAAIGQDIAGLGIDCHHVHEYVCPLEVGEERVPQPDAVGGAFQEPRDIRDRQLALTVELDRAEVGRECRERVVGDLGRGVGDAAQERRLAGVREAQERRVADHLEAQVELGRLAVLTDLRSARRLADRGREATIASPAATAPRDHDARPRVREIRDRQLAARVVDLGAERHVHDRVTAAPARLAASFAVHAALTPQVALEAERREIAHVGIGEQHDIAAVSAIAAVGPALGHELLAPEGDAAVAAPAGLHDHRRAIVEVTFAAHAARASTRRPRRSRRACRGGGRNRPCPETSANTV